MAIKVVDIIVERKGMILLIKRGDYWLLPGGEIEPGEDEMQCLEEVVAKEMIMLGKRKKKDSDEEDQDVDFEHNHEDDDTEDEFPF